MSHDLVDAAMQGGCVDIVFFGEAPPVTLRHPVESRAYRLSRAATAFKNCALDSAGHCGQAAHDTETYLAIRGGMLLPPRGADEVIVDRDADAALDEADRIAVDGG
ncbi:hypothetical protein [Mycobacterium kubicae]|uniref:Uncharacterized protein n=1 Tax=Mycobacterium kubicae TaxID=120959 RepID=A0AAX1J9G9_9MYCO|nr:hypothetical protein [Mycobacterium kubicae]MCV7094268.1 hypothetical protein [Mycobacterium kubicae]QNI09925.1 hypothetical protein GAN18_00620 [Mycobacterium kubicae]QPI38121.1 hypothetical protein I2456_00575 [Mycobacterium kubicae]